MGLPGLTLFLDLGATPIRGMHGLGDYIYCCHRGSFLRINNAGIAEEKGGLLTQSGSVDMADNGTQIMVVDGTAGYIYDLATEAFAQISAEGYPGDSATVTFLDGYFIVDNHANKGRFYVSALYDGTNWNALAYATAESNPDALIAVLAEKSLLGLWGEYSSEVWANTGALDFPFSRVQGGTMEWGLAARWSLVKFDDSVIWLARNRLGQVSVVRGAGERVSTPDLDYLFSTYTSVSDATGYGYMLSGHPMYALNFPSASRSWLFDGKTGAWSELQSYGLTRHRGETSTSFLNRTMIGDFDNGRIYILIAGRCTRQWGDHRAGADESAYFRRRRSARVHRRDSIGPRDRPRGCHGPGLGSPGDDVDFTRRGPQLWHRALDQRRQDRTVPPPGALAPLRASAGYGVEG